MGSVGSYIVRSTKIAIVHANFGDLARFSMRVWRCAPLGANTVLAPTSIHRVSASFVLLPLALAGRWRKAWHTCDCCFCSCCSNFSLWLPFVDGVRYTVGDLRSYGFLRPCR